MTRTAGLAARTGLPPAFGDEQPYPLELAHWTVDGNADAVEALGVRLHEVSGLQGPRDRVRQVLPTGGQGGCRREHGRELSRAEEGEGTHQPHSVAGLQRALDSAIQGGQR